MNLEKITRIRESFLENNEKVGKLEYTSGNYDEEGVLIEKDIPTITTEFCEIGIYSNIIYFTFVINSNSYNEKLIDSLKNFSNFKIYGFKNFLEDYNLKDLENEIKKDKYFQVNFNYSIDEKVEFLLKQYQEIKKNMLKSKIEIINQLEIDLTKE
ncbi:hypothetical protein KKH36_03950 [Patescibacteria group bacterium]|nr:hypothetical protein [Patescibacteria group bacterium]